MEIVKKIIKESSKFLNFIETKYKDKEGTINFWNWVQRPDDINAVMVVAICEKKLVAIQEYRIPLDKVVWALPAGLVNKGELPEIAAARELEEETGLGIKRILRRASPLVYNSPGLTDEAIHIIFVEAKGKISSSKLDTSEDIKPVLLDRNQVKKLLENEKEEITAKTYLIFLRFSEDGRIV